MYSHTVQLDHGITVEIEVEATAALKSTDFWSDDEPETFEITDIKLIEGTVFDLMYNYDFDSFTEACKKAVEEEAVNYIGYERKYRLHHDRNRRMPAMRQY